MTGNQKPDNKKNNRPDNLLLGLVGLISQFYTTSRENRADNDQKKANEKALVDATRKTATATIFIAIFGGITFVTVLIQAIIFGRQLDVMQGQLGAMEREQQPYISTRDEDNPPLPILANDRISWNNTIVNSGKGEAHDLTIVHGIRLGQQDQPFIMTGRAFADELGIGKPRLITTFSGLHGITQDSFDTLRRADFAISVLIELTYFNWAGRKINGNVCKSLLATGAIARLNPADCAKKEQAK
jgi:hypothetical protein